MHATTVDEAALSRAWMPVSGRGTGGVRLYSEEDLVPVAGGPVVARTPGLVRSLLEQPSAGDRRRLVSDLLHAMGFEWLGYGTVALKRGVPAPSSFFDSYSHPGWTECYFRERYYEVDLRHHEAAPCNLPLVWSLDEVGARAGGAPRLLRHREFLDQLQACGLRSGVFISLASWEKPQQRTVISFAAPRPTRDWIDDELLGRALVFALGLHEFLSLHMAAPEPAQACALAPAQEQILSGLLQGLSDKEIAGRLELSVHAVDYHMRQLRRHFGVRNRVQLAHAALGLRAG